MVWASMENATRVKYLELTKRVSKITLFGTLLSGKVVLFLAYSKKIDEGFLKFMQPGSSKQYKKKLMKHYPNYPQAKPDEIVRGISQLMNVPESTSEEVLCLNLDGICTGAIDIIVLGDFVQNEFIWIVLHVELIWLYYRFYH